MKRNRSQLLTYSGWVRKEYLTNGMIERIIKARTMNLRKNGQDLEEKLFLGLHMLRMMMRTATKITEILR